MNLESIGRRLADLAEGTVSFDRPLASFTTYRLGGPARIFFEPSSKEDLVHLTRACSDVGVPGNEVPLLVVGRGSNLVISDRGFEGVVIRLAAGFSDISGDEATGVVEAGAGTSLPLLANWAARRSLSGLEFTVGVPGSVGGGVRMNAGAHGGQISDTLQTVELFDIATGNFTQQPANELGLSYRHSRIPAGTIVTSARLQLQHDDQALIKQRMESYRRHRAETQPGALQNAGSTFKNPPGDSAGRLVEAAGLKGFRVGGASVSELHANFFVSSDEASSQDVFDLVAEVRRRVKDKFGIDLEPEVRFVGPFAAPVSVADGTGS